MQQQQQQQLMLQQQIKDLQPPQQQRQPNNNNINNAYQQGKPANPSQLRLDNLVINGPASPNANQYNGYNGSYQTEAKNEGKS